MLDFFTIFSKGGLVLWCYTFQGVKTNFTEPINALIKAAILQDRPGLYNHGSLCMQYKLDNEFDLVFVVGYQKMFQLSYVDKLLDDVQLKFRDQNKNKLLSGCTQMLSFDFNFQMKFGMLLREAEQSAMKPKEMRSFEDSEKSKKTIQSLKVEKEPKVTENGKSKTSKNSPKPGSKVSPDSPKPIKEEIAEMPEVVRKRMEFIQKQRGMGKKSPVTSKRNEKKNGKKNTKWEDGPVDAKALDYSSQPAVNGHSNSTVTLTNAELNYVNRSKNIQDLEVEDNLEEEVEKQSASKSSGGLFSMFKGLVGSKPLTKEALQPALNTMRDHLIGKNVAADIAEKMCDSVAAKLEGRVLGTFSTIASTVRQSLDESLVQILTPKRRVDILRDVIDTQRKQSPYVITFCGVNGVGKSTNLAKICFWLMENGFRVLIAACDTFRSGAVEQLRTHVARLNASHPPVGGVSKVLLFEKGYGKDAAGLAKQAISCAKEQRFDVVLVDTAGRMQDNEPLMRSLAKLITLNSPDLVLFVGEALVGNEAVDQLVKFNQALADHSNSDEPRIIDGIVLTKFDTIDDKVGAAISMTYTTGQPIVFVGTGQTYPDLRNLNPKAVVNALLK